MSNTESPPTIEQMWSDFWRMANPNRPGRKASSEIRIAYYAGCHNMLHQMLKMLRSGEANSAAWSATWNQWSAELTRHSDDYNAGRV
jgi:hypothetical protein